MAAETNVDGQPKRQVLVLFRVLLLSVVDVLPALQTTTELGARIPNDASPLVARGWAELETILPTLVQRPFRCVQPSAQEAE